MKMIYRLSLLCTSLCWSLLSVSAGFIPTLDSNHATSSINKATVKILEACYSDHKTIVVHGDSDGSVIHSLLALQSTATISINDASLINVAAEHRAKANLFLLTVDSREQLEQRLLTFKYSPWWNIMASFFILDESNGDCANAQDILETAWKMNAVTVFFLCQNSRQKLMIYSYNPYTNSAPCPWKEVKGTITKQSDRWTMYNRAYRNDGSVCDGLKFDRTKFLDGSKVRIVVARPVDNHPLVVITKYDENTTERMYRDDARFAKTMEAALNATLEMHFIVDDYHDSENLQHCFQFLRNASSDLALCLRNPAETYNFTVTYPIMHTGITVVTQRRGYYTPWERIVNFYGMITLVSMTIILSMTFVVVVMSDKRRRVAFAAFEVLRLIVNASLHSKMDTLARRIFFSMIFLYILIIQATFQGNISSFLTKQVERRNVEALEDLRDSSYGPVYASAGVIPYIHDPILEKKIVISQSDSCFQQALENRSVACMGNDYFILKGAIYNGLHFMKKSYGDVQLVYAARDDWPLKNRVDTFLMRLEQSGLSQRWSKSNFDKFLIDYERSRVRAVVHARPISLTMFTFAFNILGVGLLLAIICFIFERRFGEQKPAKKKRKNTKSRRT